MAGEVGGCGLPKVMPLGPVPSGVNYELTDGEVGGWGLPKVMPLGPVPSGVNYELTDGEVGRWGLSKVMPFGPAVPSGVNYELLMDGWGGRYVGRWGVSSNCLEWGSLSAHPSSDDQFCPGMRG